MEERDGAQRNSYSSLFSNVPTWQFYLHRVGITGQRKVRTFSVNRYAPAHGWEHLSRVGNMFSTLTMLYEVEQCYLVHGHKILRPATVLPDRHIFIWVDSDKGFIHIIYIEHNPKHSKALRSTKIYTEMYTSWWLKMSDFRAFSKYLSSVTLKCSLLFSPVNSLCDIGGSLILPYCPAGLQSAQVLNVLPFHLKCSEEHLCLC